MNGEVERTGPIGRLLRGAWALLAAVSILQLSGEQGPARFRNPHVLTEASAWLLHALMLVAFVVLVGAVARAIGGERAVRRAQRAALVGLAALVVVAAAMAQLTTGSLWGFPLADGVWIFDVGMLAVELVVFVVAIAIGLPGCELGVVPWLIARLRGDRIRMTTGLACVVGLDQVDRWEARRRRRAAPA